ncbi:hypothetical protein ACFTAO_04245 [Paenibacillus rhizoplanae]
MKEPGDEDRLLAEYFKLPVTSSPELVSNTIQRIQGRRTMGTLSIFNGPAMAGIHGAGTVFPGWSGCSTVED